VRLRGAECRVAAEGCLRAGVESAGEESVGAECPVECPLAELAGCLPVVVASAVVSAVAACPVAACPVGYLPAGSPALLQELAGGACPVASVECPPVGLGGCPPVVPVECLLAELAGCLPAVAASAVAASAVAASAVECPVGLAGVVSAAEGCPVGCLPAGSPALLQELAEGACPVALEECLPVVSVECLPVA
jgi:hypothetical protein